MKIKQNLSPRRVFIPTIQFSIKLFQGWVVKGTFGYLNGQVRGKLFGGGKKRGEKEGERHRECEKNRRSHSWEKLAIKELNPPEIPTHRHSFSL